MTINPTISQWFTRTTAGAVFGAIGALIPFLLQTCWVFQESLGLYIVAAAFILFCILLGVVYGYKYFEFPEVNYLKANRSIYYSKIIAMLWFGGLSFCLVPKGGDSIFLMLLTTLILPAVLGFSLGYRVLYLPKTTTGFSKALMIGLIGFVFAAVFYTLIMTLQAGPIPGHASTSAAINFLYRFFATYFAFIVGVVLFCPLTLIGTVIFYYFGLYLNKCD